MAMTSHDLRRRADVVRPTPLEDVLLSWGASRHRYDKAKWHTHQGPLSVSGQQFINWQRDTGGGGAIDLVMHLGEMDFVGAVAWLEQHLAVGTLALGETSGPSSGRGRCRAEGHSGKLCLPAANERLLDRVRRYLTRRRHLDASLLEPLIERGMLYADARANAVFLMVAGKVSQPVGAELRGTGARVWRGMAPGTRKDSGYFWIGPTDARTIVLCESAIDAISCLGLFPDRMCISTSGARSHPTWLSDLVDQEYAIHCGFDADAAGETTAAEMTRLFPQVQRLRPPAHDWNEALTSNRSDIH